MTDDHKGHHHPQKEPRQEEEGQHYVDERDRIVQKDTSIELSETLVRQIKLELFSKLTGKKVETDCDGDPVLDEEQFMRTVGPDLYQTVLSVIVPLPGNRVILGVDPGEELIGSGDGSTGGENVRKTFSEMPPMEPMALIPASFFIGKSSHKVWSRVGGVWRLVRGRHFHH